jgi:hypothetical protein
MDIFLQVVFGIIFLYVAVLTALKLFKVKYSGMWVIWGLRGVAALTIITTIYYLVR